ncbi:ATP-dependent DNA helicase [Derxia gummosa]|uniref:ATP-dependent DNA helicase n=1 Tax=Derxia gummosa DSM 723 TaxID=1121388 RepID=A0AC36KCC0_9BURK
MPTEQESSQPDSPAIAVKPSGARDADVERLFAIDGPVAQAAGGYRPRSAQIELAKAVAEAIDQRSAIVAEAGTGTGKTYAYLAPALLWGGKVIVSTGTKTLQDQLYHRDLPAVRKALNVPVSVALLKGRANYLCHHHAKRAFESGRLGSREESAQLRRIRAFMLTTLTGDKAELASVPEGSPVWTQVTSTRDNCVGTECADYKDCFVMKARREAQQADVIVVNHHLFFADLMLRDEGINELLPAANTIIFDEAHQLPDTATLFFGETLGSSQLLELCRDTVVEGLAAARDAARWPELVAPLEKAVRDLRLSLPSPGGQTRTAFKLAASQVALDSGFWPALDELSRRLRDLCDVLDDQGVRSEELAALARRAHEQAMRLKLWRREAGLPMEPEPEEGASTEPPTAALPLEGGENPLPEPQADPDQEDADGQRSNWVCWIDVFSTSIQLHRSPLSVARIFRREREGSQRAWVFTSATLAVKRDFSHFTRRMGLDDARAESWPSPFDYPNQGLLYAPAGMPEPQHPLFIERVVEAAWPLIEAAGGRAFLLCTTLRAVDKAAELLRIRLEAARIRLLRQGDLSRGELLETFRKSERALLIGSQSFWEGIDVRGDALSLVIIDKLPFAPPDDPVLAARLAKLTADGGNAFAQWQLPEAVITLKQGAGRLIRSETDRGVLMICDPRLVDKPYGRRIWQSLPPFGRTRVEKEAIAFLRECLSSTGDMAQPRDAAQD